MVTILELKGVSKSYEVVAGGERLNVLRDVSLFVTEGESLAITGPSGSGKSTLLNIIGTLDRPTSGSVILDGQDVTDLDDLALAELRNRRIGFVFQLHHLLPQCTVLENVLVPTLARHDGPSGAENLDRAQRLLDRVGLRDRAEHRPGQLSGGERQRVAVARALMNRPRLLLADEPTGSLDRAAAEKLAALLVEVNREDGTALVVVTHSMPLAARMGRAFELSNGTLSPGGKAG